MEYKKTKKNTYGTSYTGNVLTSYKNLVKIFGEPNAGPSPDGKVSTQWNLETKAGSIVTIYDYKKTVLYAPEYMSVEEFRNLESYNWYIGGYSIHVAEDIRQYIMLNI